MKSSAKNNSHALPVPPREQQQSATAAGWDPFEVWRTRVLLPRLAGANVEKLATPPAAPVVLIKK